MTDKEFCEFYSGFYGEEVDHVKQIVMCNFDGEELKEFLEAFEEYIESKVSLLKQKAITEGLEAWINKNIDIKTGKYLTISFPSINKDLKFVRKEDYDDLLNNPKSIS